jgi:hypothetical protein
MSDVEIMDREMVAVRSQVRSDDRSVLLLDHVCQCCDGRRCVDHGTEDPGRNLSTVRNR